MMKRIIFALFLLGLQLSSAQEITVLDLDTGEPILNVAIYNLDKSKTAVSDFDGKCDVSIFERSISVTKSVRQPRLKFNGKRIEYTLR